MANRTPDLKRWLYNDELLSLTAQAVAKIQYTSFCKLKVATVGLKKNNNNNNKSIIKTGN